MFSMFTIFERYKDKRRLSLDFLDLSTGMTCDLDRV